MVSRSLPTEAEEDDDRPQPPDDDSVPDDDSLVIHYSEPTKTGRPKSKPVRKPLVFDAKLDHFQKICIQNSLALLVFWTSEY